MSYRALVLTEEGLAYEHRESRPLQPGEARIRLQAAALNHRDLFITQGKYAAIQTGCVLGSDGCGTVVEVAEPEAENWLNTEVIINPNINWGESGRHQDMAHYRILGMPDDGTFAEEIIVPTHRLSSKPAHLTAEEAAALPLAAMTAYRAVMSRGQLKEGQKVLISGIGGGVAQYAFQIAQKIGAQVYCTSGSEEKLEHMKHMGAAGVANYKQEGWAKAWKNEGFHLVIDSAGGNQVNTLLNLLHPGGRYVFYGATHGLPDKIDLYKVFWKQLNIHGSTMASDEEFQAMTGLVQQHGIRPIIDKIFAFDQAAAAFERMEKGEQFGKIVLEF